MAWDAPTEHAQFVGGYYLYYWQADRETPRRVDVGKRTIYTLEHLEAGQLYTFAVTAHDGRGGKESVISNKVQQRMPAAGFVVDAPGVLANDQRSGSDHMTAELVNGPRYGKIDLGPDGGFTYTPHAALRGTDRFTYRTVHGALASNPVTVTLRVTSSNGENRAAASLTQTTKAAAPSAR